MKVIWIGILALVLAACSFEASQNPEAEFEKQDPPPRSETPELEDLGLAPELTNEVWLNSDRALRLSDLRGKVVLLEMWTFG